MKEYNKHTENSFQEINLKTLLLKIWEQKYFFILSLLVFLAIAMSYIKLSTPIYEVSSSILMDASGENRVLSSQSKYLDGGVNLIEMEKNIFNEIGIIKSYSLVRQTVEDLDFNISYYSKNWINYYSKNWIKEKEYYNYFPFKVILIDHSTQLLNVPFEVEIISRTKFRLRIEANDFMITDPKTNSNHTIEKDFEYSNEYSFGELIKHDYFSFVLQLQDSIINFDDFMEMDLSFIIHDYEELAKSYQAKLAVENIDINGSILTITSKGSNVKKEIDFLTKLTENYIKDKLAERNKIASLKESFIRGQLASISDSLAKAELNLELYKRNRQAINLDATSTNALIQAQKLQSEKDRIEFNIKYYNSLIQYLTDSVGVNKIAAPSAIGIDDPLLKANLLDLQRLYSEKAKNESILTSDNQRLEDVNSQINKIKEYLLENLKNLTSSSELALKETDEQLLKYNEILYSLPAREKQFQNIQRKSTLYENLYNYMSQELAKAGIASAESTIDTRVLDQARMIGDGPVSPKKRLLLVLATVLGLIIPFAWIVFKNSLNDAIEDVEQIEKNTNVKVLASIAHYRNKKSFLNKDFSQWEVEESFRDLSANLQILFPTRTNLILGVTSSVPNEGKTFCAINLAKKLAETGKKTLIIDMDLRNPSIFNDNKDSKKVGLSNYLEGNFTSVNRIIYKYEKTKNFKYIPSQVVDSNIHKLLSGEKMKSLLEDLRFQYDYIILDTPAVGLVSDYLLISNTIDINLFVIRRKVSKISYIQDFERLINNGNLSNNYIIFNDSISKQYKYGYYKKYGDINNSLVISNSFSI